MSRTPIRFVKAIFAGMLLLGALAHAQVTTFTVLPSATDTDIRTFNDPHFIYVNRGIVVEHSQSLPADRHQLLLWLTGTGGKGAGPKGFSDLAANLGYHVISLMYPDEVPAAICDNDSDPSAFEKFRMAIIEGGFTTVRNGRNTFNVDRPESIENRLIRLLRRLQRIRPREEWGQFLQEDGSIKWDSVAVAGQSQGGGHAALIGIKHLVARVICFGAPKDYSRRLNAPAAWLSEESATPKGRFFAFNHVQDPKGCTPAQLLKNLEALGLGAFGPIGQVDSEDFPYHHARALYTAYPQVVVAGEESEGAKIAHNSAISTANAERWKQVWTYLLTEESP